MLYIDWSRNENWRHQNLTPNRNFFKTFIIVTWQNKRRKFIKRQMAVTYKKNHVHVSWENVGRLARLEKDEERIRDNFLHPEGN